MNEPLFTDIVQLGLVVRDVDATVANYREMLGLKDWHINYVDSEKGKGKNFYCGEQSISAKAKIAWINVGHVELEVIEPLDENSAYAQFLRDKGPGIHHVMFATADYDACSEAMSANKVAALGSGELQQTRFQMFDTEKSLGLVCEIAEGDPLIPDNSLMSPNSTFII